MASNVQDILPTPGPLKLSTLSSTAIIDRVTRSGNILFKPAGILRYPATDVCAVTQSIPSNQIHKNGVVHHYYAVWQYKGSDDIICERSLTVEFPWRVILCILWIDIQISLLDIGRIFLDICQYKYEHFHTSVVFFVEKKVIFHNIMFLSIHSIAQNAFNCHK